MADEQQQLTEDAARSMSDDELNAALSGEETASTQESTDSETASQETAEQEETASTQESTEESEIPDWVPESLKEHYKAGKHEEAYKSVKHFQEKMGKTSKYSPLIEYFNADPEAYNKVVSYLTKGEDKATQTEAQIEKNLDKGDNLIEQLKASGYEEMVPVIQALQNQYKSELDGLRGEIGSYKKEQQEQYVKDRNLEAISKFNEAHTLEQDDLVQFLSTAEKVVLPTGNKNGIRFYTQKDLENAYKIVYPEKYEQDLIARTKNDMLQNLKSANEQSEALPSSQAQHDATVKGVGKLDNAKSRDEAEQMVHGMSDDEFKEEMKKRGLATNRFISWK